MAEVHPLDALIAIAGAHAIALMVWALILYIALRWAWRSFWYGGRYGR